MYASVTNKKIIHHFSPFFTITIPPDFSQFKIEKGGHGPTMDPIFAWLSFCATFPCKFCQILFENSQVVSGNANLVIEKINWKATQIKKSTRLIFCKNIAIPLAFSTCPVWEASCGRRWVGWRQQCWSWYLLLAPLSDRTCPRIRKIADAMFIFRVHLRFRFR